jgi:hypothetical protein
MTTKVRAAVVGVVFAFQPIAFAVADDIIRSGDATIGEYLQNAASSFEASPGPKAGRLKAVRVIQTGQPGLSDHADDWRSEVTAIWDGDRFFIEATWEDRLKKRMASERPGGPAWHCGTTKYAYDGASLVRAEFSCPDGKAIEVHVHPGGSRPKLADIYTVLPSSSVQHEFYLFPPSRQIAYFRSDRKDDGQQLKREILNQDDILILRQTDIPTGEIWENRYSNEFGGHLVQYSVAPGTKSQIKYRGTMKWARDASGEVYLKRHEFEQTDPKGTPASRRYNLFVCEDFETLPAVKTDRFSLASLGVSDDTPMQRFGDNPYIPIWTGTVGGKPLIPDQGKELDSLVEQLKNRGFARPERTK